MIQALDLSTTQPHGFLWLKFQFSASGQEPLVLGVVMVLDAGPTQLSSHPLVFHTPPPWAFPALLHTLPHALFSRLYSAETGHIPF